MDPIDVSRLFATFNAGAPAFRDESAAQGGPVPVTLGRTARPGAREKES
jgi:hypothetical protein